MPVKSYVRARYVLALSHRGAKQTHVWYGSGTPGPLSDWTLQVCCAQLLQKPKGRQDVVLIGSFCGTESHYKASWGSVQDETHICRRRGIFRNPEQWGAHAGHLWVKALLLRLQPLACVKTTPDMHSAVRLILHNNNFVDFNSSSYQAHGRRRR